MLEMTCEEHDKLAARSQFLTHTIGRILSEMDVEPTPLDTKGFQKLVEVVGATTLPINMVLIYRHIFKAFNALGVQSKTNSILHMMN